MEHDKLLLPLILVSTVVNEPKPSAACTDWLHSVHRARGASVCRCSGERSKDRVVPNQVPAGATGAETHLVEQKFFQDTELHS